MIQANLNLGEARTAYFRFWRFPELLTGDTIATVPFVLSAPVGLTFGTPIIGNYTDPLTSIQYVSSQVSVTVSGGARAQNYQVRCAAKLGSGAILVGSGWLDVEMQSSVKGLVFEQAARHLVFEINGTLRTLIPGELRTAYFRFWKEPEIKSGDAIASMPVPAFSCNPSGLIFGTPSLISYTDPASGNLYPASVISVPVSGGQSGNLYALKCQVTTAGGAMLARNGQLYVGNLV